MEGTEYASNEIKIIGYHAEAVRQNGTALQAPNAPETIRIL